MRLDMLGQPVRDGVALGPVECRRKVAHDISIGIERSESGKSSGRH